MGQMVVITGLADGMGRHVAEMLAKSGHSVAGFDMDAKGIASLASELKDIGGDHLLETIDITDRPAILKFRDQVLARYGRVDTVLSNVGIGFFSPFEEVQLEKALKCLEINVIGAAAIFQAFLPSMRERRAGKLIAMSSLVGAHSFSLRIHLFRKQIRRYRNDGLHEIRGGAFRHQSGADRTGAGIHDVRGQDPRSAAREFSLPRSRPAVYRAGQ